MSIEFRHVSVNFQAKIKITSAQQQNKITGPQTIKNSHMAATIGNDKTETKARLHMLGLGDEIPNFTCQTQVRRVVLYSSNRCCALNLPVLT